MDVTARATNSAHHRSTASHKQEGKIIGNKQTEHYTVVENQTQNPYPYTLSIVPGIDRTQHSKDVEQ